MADAELEVTSKDVQAEDSDSVKQLLSVISVLGDSMSVADRAKYEGLIARARESDLNNG